METTYGNLIAHFRKKAGLTKKQLAESLSIDVYKLYCYEENINFPDDATMFKINNFLQIPIQTKFADENFNNIFVDEKISNKIDVLNKNVIKKETIDVSNYGKIINYYRQKANITKKKMAEDLDISLYDLNCFEENLKIPSQIQKNQINNYLNIPDLPYLPCSSFADSETQTPVTSEPKFLDVFKINESYLNLFFNNDITNDNYGDTLKFLRKKVNMTKKDFANELDLNLYHVYCFEENLRKPTKEERVRINDFFGVNLNEAVDLTRYNVRLLNAAKPVAEQKSVTSKITFFSVKKSEVKVSIIMVLFLVANLVFSLIFGTKLAAIISFVAGIVFVIVGVIVFKHFKKILKIFELVQSKEFDDFSHENLEKIVEAQIEKSKQQSLSTLLIGFLCFTALLICILGFLFCFVAPYIF